VIFPLETLHPPGDLNGGILYLGIVLSPEQASHMLVFLNSVFFYREGVYRALVGKQEGKRQLGRPRRRWVDNIRMDLQEVGCGYMDWIGLAQDKMEKNEMGCASAAWGRGEGGV
jgi:hypothetical protein